MNSLEFVDGETVPDLMPAALSPDSPICNRGTRVDCAEEQRQHEWGQSQSMIPQLGRIIRQKIGLLSQVGLHEIREVSTVHEKSCSTSKILHSNAQSRVMAGSFTRGIETESLQLTKELTQVESKDARVSHQELKMRISAGEQDSRDQPEKTPVGKPTRESRTANPKNIFFETESNDNDQDHDWEQDTFFCKSRKYKQSSNRFTNANYVSPEYKKTSQTPTPNAMTFALKSSEPSDGRLQTSQKLLGSSSRSSKRHVFQKFNSFSKGLSNGVPKSVRNEPLAQSGIKVFRAEVVSSRQTPGNQDSLQHMIKTVEIDEKPAQTGKGAVTAKTISKTRGASNFRKTKSNVSKNRQCRSSSKQYPKHPKRHNTNWSHNRNYRSLNKMSTSAKSNYSKTQLQARAVLKRRKKQRHYQHTFHQTAKHPSYKHSSKKTTLTHDSKLFSHARQAKTSPYFRQRSTAKQPRDHQTASNWSLEKNILVSHVPHPKKSIVKSASGKKSGKQLRRKRSRDASKNPVASVYSRISQPVQTVKTSQKKTSTTPIASSSTFEKKRKSSKQANKTVSTRPKFSQLKKLVSANLKSIETCYWNKHTRLDAKQYAQAKAARGGPKVPQRLLKKASANKENTPWNCQSPQANKLQTRAQRGQKPFAVHKILTRFRNKSLKTYKQSKYKSRVLSREKYINQRVNQMINLQRR